MRMKMMIVMRKDLNMRKGKMCAQACHAALGVMALGLTLKDPKAYAPWYQENQEAKICVGVNSEKELLDIYDTALNAGILAYLVQDAGRTEFHGEPTYTCLAIEPCDSDKVDKITGGLSLL